MHAPGTMPVLDHLKAQPNGFVESTGTIQIMRAYNDEIQCMHDQIPAITANRIAEDPSPIRIHVEPSPK
jgi:hypothetical protein